MTKKIGMLRLLLKDKFATCAAVILATLIVVALFSPVVFGDLATDQNLSATNLPPLSLDAGWQYILGSDPLGRSVLVRLMTASQTTLAVVIPTVLIGLVIGSLWGVWAAYHRGWRETLSMRIVDIIMSFPSLLLAVVILFVLAPSVANIILVLAVTRLPVYMRTARAEAAEVRSRTFVDAARTLGAGSNAILGRHIIPVVLPTLLTLATLEISHVLLAESALSFLGIGVQPPDVSWGLMVAQGRSYLQTAWWLSFFPGIAIVLTAISANLLAAWMRIALDPAQRWRLTVPQKRIKATLRRIAWN